MITLILASILAMSIRFWIVGNLYIPNVKVHFASAPIPIMFFLIALRQCIQPMKNDELTVRVNLLGLLQCERLPISVQE